MQMFIAELRQRYGADAVSTRMMGTETLVKVAGVPVPHRSNVMTDVLIVLASNFRTNGGRPPVYVKPGTTQPNGRPGRNVNPALVHGESWLGMSWQFDWSAGLPAWTLVEGAVRRFSINDD